MLKLILYVIVMPIVIWGLDSVKFNNILKSDKMYQARLLYILLVFGLSNLVVNFLLDFSGV